MFDYVGEVARRIQIQLRKPRMPFFTLQRERVQAGDIVLVTNDSIHAAFIRFMTFGSYSHALICVGDGLLVEAQPVGIKTTNCTQIEIDSRKQICVLRLKAGWDPDGMIRENAAAWAYEQYGHEYNYDYLPIFTTRLWPDLPKKAKSARFCFEVVAEAYSNAGLTVLDVPAMAATSKSFIASEYFENVSHEVVVSGSLRLFTKTGYRVPKPPGNAHVEVARAINRSKSVRTRCFKLRPATSLNVGVIYETLFLTKDAVLDGLVADILMQHHYSELPLHVDREVRDIEALSNEDISNNFRKYPPTEVHVRLLESRYQEKRAFLSKIEEDIENQRHQLSLWPSSRTLKIGLTFLENEMLQAKRDCQSARRFLRESEKFLTSEGLSSTAGDSGEVCDVRDDG